MQDLSIRFDGAPKNVNVVDDVSFSVSKGKTLCIVGESGCGKSVTSLSIMRLLDVPPAEIPTGEIWLEDRNLLSLSEEKMRHVRGNDVAMIFQEPMTSLNPAFTIGDQIAEGIVRHRKVSRAEAMERALDMLKKVRIPAPEKRLRAGHAEVAAQDLADLAAHRVGRVQ